MIMPSDHSLPAPNVCVNCKARKKKCDKASPSCGYCTRKGLRCQYRRPKVAIHYARSIERHLGLVDGAGFNPIARLGLGATSSSLESTLSLHAQQIISTTGSQYFDEISVRYFQTVHPYIPIISRERFHTSLITFGATQQADFAILLLSMCLLTSRPSLDTDTTALYLSSRSLFLQAQTLCQPSLRLVQAGVLFAVFEYAQRSPEQALITVGGCVRMAHTAGLQGPSYLPVPKPAQGGGEVENSNEHTNTWWAIMIYERLFLCEQAVIDQPLVSIMPEICLTSAPQDGFRQAAQAAWLLDRVLGALSTPDSEDRHTRLQGLDLKLQAFIAMTSEPSLGDSGVYCWAISIAIRALFLLHHRLLSCDYDGTERSANSSCAALDTLTRMVVDIAELHKQLSSEKVDALPPSCRYMLKAAVKEGHSKDSAMQAGLDLLKEVDEHWGRRQ
ncbi:hypothetical protein BJY01DRAFT_221080 [Aspergillus pseudoustus]|uniref:Zn(2)-C6 fungal-type domain-containing protein n=1 Tax=Aspergillus pseudoustus TaxID=1810923 RepID=A0ABR4JBA4_9EURO